MPCWHMNSLISMFDTLNISIDMVCDVSLKPIFQSLTKVKQCLMSVSILGGCLEHISTIIV